jgi:hypothetical protein
MDHRIVIALNSSHVTKTENKNRRGSLSSAKIYATNPLPATAHFVDGDRIPSKR